MKKKKVMIQLVILIVAVFFLIWGFQKEQPLQVMQKAINICLECIGIG